MENARRTYDSMQPLSLGELTRGALGTPERRGAHSRSPTPSGRGRGAGQRLIVAPAQAGQSRSRCPRTMVANVLGLWRRLDLASLTDRNSRQKVRHTREESFAHPTAPRSMPAIWKALCAVSASRSAASAQSEPFAHCQIIGDAESHPQATQASIFFDESEHKPKRQYDC
jgi:hypothetical protein